jgi:hypothetical protein
VAGPRQLVDGPDFEPLPYALWDAVEQRSPGDPHWQNGVTWQEWCPQVPDTLYDECIAVTGTGSPPPFPTLPAGGNVIQRNRGATPFTVYAEFDCSPVGLADMDLARTAIGRLESYAVENAFWTGLVGGVANIAFPHLAANAQVLDSQNIILQSAATQAVTGTGVDVTDALGQLEAQLAACYGGRGVIHIPRRALPTFQAWTLVHDEGGKLYTAAGNLVVPGGGYPGTAPDGSAPAAGQSWIYATGQMFGYRSDVTSYPVPESLDKRTNTIHSIAQRTYVLGYECCLIAAQIATGVPASPTV